MSQRKRPASRRRLPPPPAVHCWTHPDHLGALATLFGLEPAPVAHCRLLELGCAAAANLIPMATALPDSEFLGLDTSAERIAEGRAFIAALSLTNIRLDHADLADASTQLGAVDYLIAPGLYSTGPPEVRGQILALAERVLRPQGVACIRYNVAPGGRARGLVRDMIRDQIRDTPALPARLAAARALLPSLLEAAPEYADYAAVLRDELALISGASDTQMAHEYLAEADEPILFHEFAERAAAHGLEYLADAQAPVARLPQRLAEALGPLDRIATEQYHDFFHGRVSRASLLCRAGQTLEHEPKAERLAHLHFSSPARFAPPGPDLSAEKEELFACPGGPSVTTPTPFVKAAFGILEAAWPRAVAFANWPQEAQSRLAAVAPPAAAADLTFLTGALAEVVLFAFARGVVEVHASASGFVTEASARPLASPLARWQAAHGPFVTTLRHEPLKLDDPWVRRVLRHCDGRHDRAALAACLEKRLRADDLVVGPAGHLVRGSDRRAALEAGVETTLAALARAALLMA